MPKIIDKFWELAEFEAEPLAEPEPRLDLWRWSFAYLPTAHMKAVAADWLVRVLLGGDPADVSEEEVQILAMGALLATEKRGALPASWSWDA